MSNSRDIYCFVVEGYSYSRGWTNKEKGDTYYKRKIKESEYEEITQDEFKKAIDKHLFITQLEQLKKGLS